MTAVQIRRLVPTDLPAYKALRDASLAAYPEAFSSSTEPERAPESYLRRLGSVGADGVRDGINGGEFTLGAWLSGRLVGAVSCERDPRPKVNHIGHLIGMMVSADVQGQGIGRALLEACVAQARAAHGLVLLTLTVTAGNAAAVGLYERAGFQRHGRLDRAICVDGVYHAKDQMVLAL
jgi:ribosomal protein S18 acetylase RimI-like enzyme